MKYKIETSLGTFDINLLKYGNGRTALELSEDEGTYAIVSVNLPDAPDIPDDHIYTKTWSENEPVVSELIALGVLLPTKYQSVQSGFVTAPVYKINFDFPFGN